MDKILEFIKNNKSISLLLGFIGTILLGALGSGAWEYIVKPLLSYSLNSILDLSTLGIEALKNDIYLSIAQGFSERNSIQIYTFITTLYFGIVLSVYFTILKKIKKKTHKNEDEDGISNNKQFSKKIYLSFLLIFVFFIFVSIQNVRLQYINNSIIHYNQLMNISKPFISDIEVKKFDSDFALIKNKNDYERIINDLFIVLERNKIEFKKINIW